MDQTNRTEFAALLSGMAEVLGKDLSATIADSYWTALADLPIEVVRRAVNRAVAESKFFPKPAELRELAGGPRKTAEERATLAWIEAWAAASSVGAYSSVKFADTTTTRVIRAMGGWPAFCRPEDEEKWRERKFKEFYAAMDGTEHDIPQRHLAGLHEADNREKGLPQWIRPPAIVGAPGGPRELPPHDPHDPERGLSEVLAEIAKRSKFELIDGGKGEDPGLPSDAAP